MEKITGKKFALNNSYFKNIRFVEGAPQTPAEVFEYYEEFKEFPFKDLDLEEDEILFEIFGEFNKIEGVLHDQFFTPPIIADRMAYLLDEYSKIDTLDEYSKHTEPLRVLDICCGYGQLTYPVEKFGFLVSGIDFDKNLCKLYEKFTNSGATKMRFQDLIEKEDLIISNPPYSIPVLTEFLYKLYDILSDRGFAVILLPKGFIEKEKPKKLYEILQKFEVIHREEKNEEFKSAKIKTEILVLKKIN